MMKHINKYSIFLSLLTVFLYVSCSDKDTLIEDPSLEVTANNIQGTWQLVQWNGNNMTEGTYVYLEFTRRDRRFTLYQNQDSFLPRKIEGDYNIIYDEELGSIIRGQYDYNGEWTHRYIISSLTANSMTWVAVDDKENIQIFNRCPEIPLSTLE